MGRFIEGVWHGGFMEKNDSGTFERKATSFRAHVKMDPSSPFPAENGRYHVYASHACPWAHRVLITRALRGLEDAISVTLVDPKMGELGWSFSEDAPDPIFGAKTLGEIYLHTDPKFTGRVTVPILWDRKTKTIVNNESREIIRMLDSEFNAFAKNPTRLAPPELDTKIDEALDAIYVPINNGVYAAGFATKQEPYEKAVKRLFLALEHWDAVLAKQAYLTGETFTLADIAMFTTLARFDLVYYSHFKCNVKRLADFANLSRFVRDVYARPEVRASCHFDQIKTHYYWSQITVNPTQIVPVGPAIDWIK